LIHLRIEARLKDVDGLLPAEWHPTSTHVPLIQVRIASLFAAPILVYFQGLEYENALALVWLPNWLVEVYGFVLMARTKLQEHMKDCHQMNAVCSAWRHTAIAHIP